MYEEKEIIKQWEKYLNNQENDYLTSYINTPSCLSKCNFCIWGPEVLKNQSELDDYLDILEKQFIKFTPLFKGIKTSSIYFGGGTPTIYSPDQLKRLFYMVEKYLDLDAYGNNQFSIETHPKTITLEKLDIIYNSFINRISMGIQTFCDQILEKEGRDNGTLNEISNMILIILNKFKDRNFLLNVDLMANLHDQETQILINDFNLLYKLGVPKITVYPKKNSNNHDEEMFQHMEKQRKKYIEPLIDFVDDIDRYDYLPTNSTNGEITNNYYYNFVLKDFKFNFNKLYFDRPISVNNLINSNFSYGKNCYSWIRTDFAYHQDNKYTECESITSQKEYFKEIIKSYPASGKIKKIYS